MREVFERFVEKEDGAIETNWNSIPEEYARVWDDPDKRDALLYDPQDLESLKIGGYEEYYDPAKELKCKEIHMKGFYGKEVFSRFKREIEESKRPGSDRPSAIQNHC
ncbi:MAG: hypothetical protein V1793_17140 [Pseudomonadota bacterium]